MSNRIEIYVKYIGVKCVSIQQNSTSEQVTEEACKEFDIPSTGKRLISERLLKGPIT